MFSAIAIGAIGGGGGSRWAGLNSTWVRHVRTPKPEWTASARKKNFGQWACRRACMYWCTYDRPKIYWTKIAPTQKIPKSTFDPGGAPLWHFTGALLIPWGLHSRSAQVVLPLDQKLIPPFLRQKSWGKKILSLAHITRTREYPEWLVLAFAA